MMCEAALVTLFGTAVYHVGLDHTSYTTCRYIPGFYSCTKLYGSPGANSQITRGKRCAVSYDL